MGLSYGIFICFLLLGGMELCCPQTIWPTETYYPLTSRPPVMVDCLESQLVVTVSKDLFGTGKLIRPADLTLGPENCEPLVSMDTDDVVRFEVGLHECGSRVQVTDNALVYSTFLIHSPRPAGNLSILRTNRAEVPIECHYPRHSNVSSQAILPTWVPFRTTMLFEEKLVFSLRLMEEDWGSEKQSPTFQLGDIAHLQAEVHTGSHMPLRLFVDHCVATLTPDRNAFPHHKIVDFHGCLVDGLYNSSSAFKAPRPRPETLQFTVDVFHFAKDSRNTIYITCHLKVTPADRVPDQLNKACSFIKSTKSKILNLTLTEEAEITVGPLIFLGKASDHGIEGSTSPHTSVMLGLGLATVVSLTLATIVLVLAKRHRTASHPVICPASVSQ
uniref:Zona pellucida sperm-binding protein 3 n=1 Tax=Canis lupus familiaris TaxID=9615 RepID=A0A8C0RFQ1_CANLF